MQVYSLLDYFVVEWLNEYTKSLKTDEFCKVFVGLKFFSLLQVWSTVALLSASYCSNCFYLITPPCQLCEIHSFLELFFCPKFSEFSRNNIFICISILKQSWKNRIKQIHFMNFWSKTFLMEFLKSSVHKN